MLDGGEESPDDESHDNVWIHRVGVDGLAEAVNLARHRIPTGDRLLVWNRSPGRDAPVLAAGGVVVAEPRALIAAADVVLVMLPAGSVARWGAMSRRKRENRRLHVVPDPQPTGGGDRGRSGREPQPGLYAVPDLGPPNEPSPAVVELVRELERMGMPREIVEHGMAFGDNAEELELWVRGLQLALAGDPLSGLLTPWEPLLARRTTVLDAELGGAEILASYADMGDEDPAERLSRLMAEAQRSGKPEALAMCRMVAHLGPAQVREQATGTADSLVAAGVRDRPWVRQLGTAQFHRSYGIGTPGNARVQVLEFAYGPKAHALAVMTCEDCGGVQSVRFTDAAAALYTDLRLDAKESGLRVNGATAAEAARIVRDALDIGICLDEENADEDGGDLAVLLPVLLERLSRMPLPDDD